jgi:hypothetical protein
MRTQGRRSAPACAACLAAVVALTGCNRPPPPLIEPGPATPSSEPSQPAASPAPAASVEPSPSPSPEPLDTSAYNRCEATLTRPSPPSGGRQTVKVKSAVPSGPVKVTLTYGRRSQSLTGTTDPQGKAEILFRTLEGTSSGTPVQVDVAVGSSGRCSTRFTVG